MTYNLKTPAEAKEEIIQKAIKAGVSLSRHCRNCWTGERTRGSIAAERIIHWPALVVIGTKGSRPLIDFADVADLKEIYLGRPDQHTWNEERWENELRAYAEKK